MCRPILMIAVAVLFATACTTTKADLTPLVLQEVRITGPETDRDRIDYLQTAIGGELFKAGMIHGENGVVIDAKAKWTGTEGSQNRTVEIRGQMMDPTGLSYSVIANAEGRNLVTVSPPDDQIASLAAYRFTEELSAQFKRQRERRPNAQTSKAGETTPQPGTYTSSSRTPAPKP